MEEKQMSEHETQSEVAESALTNPLVVDGKDKEVIDKCYKIFSDNQNAIDVGPGHYIKLVGGNVLKAVGKGTEKESTFKIYSSSDAHGMPIDILAIHSHDQNKPDKVVAVENTNNQYRVALKDLQRGYLDSLQNFRSVKYSDEIVFKRIPCSPGSERCYYQSTQTGRTLILGFDQDGQVMDPTIVQPTSEEARLKIHAAPSCT